MAWERVYIATFLTTGRIDCSTAFHLALSFALTCSVVVMLCGGNIDTAVLGRCLERGLAADGRLVRFAVCVEDRPGGVAALTQVLCKCNVR